MSQKYVAVYDSGIGGLTVLKRLVTVFKKESFIYIGDNEFAPYGSKTEGELFNRAYTCIDSLLNYDIKMLVIACNTLSTVCGNMLKKKYAFPIITMAPNTQIEGKRSLVIGTPNTISSIKLSFKKPGEYTLMPIPALAGDIENNVFNLKRLDVKKYFKNQQDVYDRVVIGCTHYAFVKSKIKAVFPSAKLDDGVDAVVKQMKEILKEGDGLQNTNNVQNISLNKSLSDRVIFVGNSAKKNKQVFISVLKAK